MKYLNPFIIISLVLLATLWPHTAWAADGLFSVSDNDIAKKEFIDYIGGTAIGGQGPSAFGAIIGIFNGAVMTLGGIYLAYTFIFGTAQGAHDGQFLGKRWSSLWIPIRMVTGVVLAAPSLAGGLCIAQWLILWLSLQGIGFANLVWTSYTANIASGGVASSINSAQAYSVVRNMYMNNVCAELFNKYAKDGGPGTPEEKAANLALVGNSHVEAFPVVPSSKSSTSGGIDRQFNYSLEGSLQSSKANAICGSVTFHADSTPQGAMDIGDGQGATTGTNYSGDAIITLTTTVKTAQGEIDKAAQKINQEQYIQLGIIQNNVKKIADQYIIDGQNSKAALEAEAERYQKAVDATYQAQSATLASSGQTFSNQVKQDGFIVAGGYFMQAAKIKHALAAAVNNWPHTTLSPAMTKDIQINTGGGWNPFTDDSNAQGFLTFFTQIRGDYIKAKTQTLDPTIDNSPYTQESIANSDNTKGFGSFVTKLFSNEKMNPASLFIFSGDQDPFFMAMDVGDKLIEMSTIVLALGLAGSFLSGAIGSLAIAIWALLAIPGEMLSFIIPMMPFVIWVSCIMSWFVLVVEAFVAAPIWAVTHLNPEGGEGIAGKAGMGWQLILSLTLRPVLMVFGLIGAIILMRPIGSFISATFGFAFGGIPSSGIGSILNMAAGAVLYALVMFFTVTKIFELVHTIPDRLMKWMGGSESGLDFSKEAGAMAAGAAYMGGKGLGNVASKGGRAVEGLKKLGQKKPKGDGDGDGKGGKGPSGGNGSPALSMDQMASRQEGQQDAPLPSSGNVGGTHNTPKPSALGKSSGSGSSRSSGSGSKGEVSPAMAEAQAEQSALYNTLKGQSPEIRSALKDAKEKDYKAGKLGQHGNTQSQLMTDMIEEAKTARDAGLPLTDAQETLIKIGNSREKIRGLRKKS